MEKKVYNTHERKEREKCTAYKLYKTMGMCTFIKMEYLVANALVELHENKKIDRISLDDIQNYGIKVEKVLSKNMGIQAILLYSNEYTREFLHDYSDFFVYEDNYIKIKSGVSIDAIRDQILSYVSVDILLALLDESSLKVIHAA